jgi:2,3-bisphosphoglycerate-independent phosphoglycerate mutase
LHKHAVKGMEHNMKYIVLLGDGMSDYPIPELNGKTPLQAANKPNMDFLAANGVSGLVHTIPPNLPPGSDVANLSVLGYDPEKYYTGRSPLEAVSMGVPMKSEDVSFRTNLVTLTEAESYEDRVMVDHSSDEISSQEAALLMDEVNKRFQNDFLTFYKGVSYRHCLLWRNGSTNFDLTPPHDIIDQRIAPFLPKGRDSKVILQMMEDSTRFLTEHPVNRERMRRGLRPANSIWIWGQGKKPAIPSFHEKYGLKGAVISAVDLVKGLGLCAGMQSIDVQGATGTLHTNYRGKAEAALTALKTSCDFVYIHVEAPDECGHRNEVHNKVRAIELIDEQILAPILKGLEDYQDYKILLLPDHPTPLSLRTHTSEPVPFAMYQKSGDTPGEIRAYDEFAAQKSGIVHSSGPSLMTWFINQAVR